MNNRILAERYHMGRLRWIAAFAGIAAGIAFLLGQNAVALGAIAATPIGMLNYYLMVRAVRDTGEKPKVIQGRIMKFSLLRTLISAVTLFVAFGISVDFMLGALAGVVSEMFTYMGDTVRLIRSMQRGDE